MKNVTIPNSFQCLSGIKGCENNYTINSNYSCFYGNLIKITQIPLDVPIDLNIIMITPNIANLVSNQSLDSLNNKIRIFVKKIIEIGIVIIYLY